MALSDNLTAYWPCDEASGSILDSHGSNDLTESAGDTIDSATGKVGGARDFEAGETEYAEIADNADLSTGDIDFSFSVWVNPEATTGFPVVLGKWTSSTSTREYVLFLASGAPRFSVTSSGSATTEVTWGAALSTGTWYHICFGHNATTNEIWITVDAGTPVTAAHTTGVRDGTRPFELGASSIQSLYWDGLIDEVGFWKRDIRSDVAELYNSGNGRDYAYISGGGGGGDPEAGLIGGKLIRGGLLLRGCLVG